MPKPSGKSPERKLQVVLAVLRGEVSAADAARRAACFLRSRWPSPWLRSAAASVHLPQAQSSSGGRRNLSRTIA